jgi:type I restriction enzyme M protein
MAKIFKEKYNNAMLTGELRSKIDKVWDAFWTGGISNPLTVIEQITYLLFIKRLDEIQTRKENKANSLGKSIENPIFTEDQESIRWNNFKHMAAQDMFENMVENVFPFIKNFHPDKQTTYAQYMKDAVFIVPTANLLEKVVTMLDSIPMEDRDTKGDVYEYLLSKLETAGQNGQFRTPRHIIKMMVELVVPTPEDIVCDPACGTAGYLIAVCEYIIEHYPEIFTDDRLRDHFNNAMFFGNDFDVTMIRIAVMNMMLHGIENPQISNKDALSQSSAENEESCTLILANPPFKGSLDEDVVAKDLLAIVKTKKTELLFLALFLRMLRIGGRCAVIVPDGVLFGSSKAHKDIRKLLIDNHKLHAVISMPSGVFKPYAGVSTAVLIFTKTNSGGTDKVWFYDMHADGYSLDDKRTKLDETKHENNNIPDIIKRFQNLSDEESRKRTDQSFLVPVIEIREKEYDLSINRYKEVEHEEMKYDPPKKILNNLNLLENEILSGMKSLQEILD